MTALYDFFYSGQIRRFMTQFMRIMSGFQVEFGADIDGNTTLQRVPVIWGDGDRQVMAALRGNSENTMPPVPCMAAYISGITYDRDRVQDPTFVSKMNIRQREFDHDTGTYTEAQGNAFTVERQMPVPYTLQLKLDIWTSNTNQKLQLLEQIGVLFNPGLEVQSTDNYIDWTSLSVIILESPNWSSRTVPVGTNTPIDIMTFNFKLPIWLSPPVKVKKLGVIEKIVASIHDAKGELTQEIWNNDSLLGFRQYFTPTNYSVMLLGNTLMLMAITTNDPLSGQHTKKSWKDLVNVYGTLKNGISQVRLESNDYEIVGHVSYHPTDDSLLIFNADMDTLPANSITAVNAIVDPHKDTAIGLVQSATAGTRFLILKDIGSFDTPNGYGPELWRGANGVDLVAHGNDIIEFDGSNWKISFDSITSTTVQYVSNLTTGNQYKYEDGEWTKSFESVYPGGRWTLVL
jgi:hypothetical protein